MTGEQEQRIVAHLLSTGEVAERLGLSTRAVLHRAHTGSIPIVGRFGVQHQLVFREDDIEEIAAQP